MSTPEFLRIDEVIDIHSDQIERYGGADGLRDAHALMSAIAMPQSGASGEYFHRDLFEMAAAYLFHLVQNHPFVDGNKRTGLAAALVFLEPRCSPRRPGLVSRLSPERLERLQYWLILPKCTPALLRRAAAAPAKLDAWGRRIQQRVGPCPCDRRCSAVSCLRRGPDHGHV